MNTDAHASRIGNANKTKLQSCGGPHEFVRVRATDRDDKALYRCRTCGGEATTAGVQFYLAGLRHMRALMRQAPADASPRVADGVHL